MKEQEQNRGSELEISLKQIFSALWNKAWLIALVGVCCGLAMFVVTRFLITPLYESSAIFYVNNGSMMSGKENAGISSSDITASKNLVDSYIIILKTRETMNQVAQRANLDMEYEQLLNMISASSVNSTELFQVVVTSPDPAEAKAIAEAVAAVLPPRIAGIIEGSSAEVVDSPALAAEPSSPNVFTNVTLAALAGMAVVMLIVFLRELFDVTIRTEEDVTSSCNYPVLTEVPDMDAPSKGGYYSKKPGKTQPAAEATPAYLRGRSRFGGNLSFTAAEAYKLLRTKLEFSFTDEGNCRVIGVVSALSGEGKSLTSANLTYTLAQLDKKVLLIECDMRRPSLSTVLPVLRTPGLSNYLTRQAGMEQLLQPCVVDDGKVSFQVISAGRTPPNPVELLSSPRMEKLIGTLRESFDYIILDLPPVGEVSDGLAVAGMADGMLMVVRQNYCNRVALADAVRQFAFVNARILGTVYNCTCENSGAYSRKKYYYYRSYNPANRSGGKKKKKSHKR